MNAISDGDKTTKLELLVISLEIVIKRETKSSIVRIEVREVNGIQDELTDEIRLGDGVLISELFERGESS